MKVGKTFSIEMETLSKLEELAKLTEQTVNSLMDDIVKRQYVAYRRAAALKDEMEVTDG